MLNTPPNVLVSLLMLPLGMEMNIPLILCEHCGGAKAKGEWPFIFSKTDGFPLL
jgi:hypothetical protein